VRIPGSGGSILAPLVGAFRLPMCIFCIPFILLLMGAVGLIQLFWLWRRGWFQDWTAQR
jgi:hypothetical protein